MRKIKNYLDNHAISAEKSYGTNFIPYFKAVLSIAGTAISFTSLINLLAENPTITREATGNYRLTFATANLTGFSVLHGNNPIFLIDQATDKLCYGRDNISSADDYYEITVKDIATQLAYNITDGTIEVCFGKYE